MKIGSVMVTVVLDPTWVHDVPLVDLYALNVLPERTSRTQYGAAAAVLLVVDVLPPAEVRR